MDDAGSRWIVSSTAAITPISSRTTQMLGLPRRSEGLPSAWRRALSCGEFAIGVLFDLCLSVRRLVRRSRRAARADHLDGPTQTPDDAADSEGRGIGATPDLPKLRGATIQRSPGTRDNQLLTL